MSSQSPGQETVTMDIRVTHRKYATFGPALKIRVTGDGWTRRHGFPRKIPDQVFHSEWWTQPNKEGLHENRVPKRKNKRDFPTFPPLPSR